MQTNPVAPDISQNKLKGIQGIYAALDEWRSKTVTTMLSVVAVFGFLSVVTLVIGTYNQPRWLPSALIFMGTYLALLGLLFFKGMGWRARAWGLISIIYIVGIIAMARGGLAGAGREYLLIIPILATVLISIRAGMLSALFSLLVMSIFSFLMNAGFFREVLIYQENPTRLADWAEEVAYTVVLMCVATSLVILFHRYVLKILLAERKASQDLAHAHASLEEYSQTLEIKVSQRTAELAQAYEIVEQSRSRMESELAMAGRIQSCFMAQELPQIPGWQRAGILIPARETTGDFYYLAPLGNQRYSILIADVVDKGVGAALLMSFCWGLLQTFAHQHPDRPDWIARKLNQGLCRDTHATQFVTLFYGLLNTQTQVMDYINAGHNPPLIFCRSQASVHVLGHTGVPLGLFPTQSWGMDHIQFNPGDCLVLYTDGVTDAENSAHEHFGQHRLIEAIRANLEKPAAEIQDSLIEQINQFTGSREPFDDLTLLVLQRDYPG